MSPHETQILPKSEPVGEIYPHIDGSFDPLELALAALDKLRTAGMPTYIPTQENETPQLDVNEAQGVVIRLDNYRHAKRPETTEKAEPAPTPKKPRSFPAPPPEELTPTPRTDTLHIRRAEARRARHAESDALVISKPAQTPKDLPEQMLTGLGDNLLPSKLDHKGRLSRDEQHRLVALAQQGDSRALESIWIDAQQAANYVASRSSSGWPKEDKIQVCLEVVPGVVERFNPEAGANFQTFLLQRMFFALKDEERAYGVGNGMSRGDYHALNEALKSDDPNAAIHELAQPRQLASGELRPGFWMAPYLVEGLEKDKAERDTSAKPSIISVPQSLEALLYGDNYGSIDGMSNSHEPAADYDIFDEVLTRAETEWLRDSLKQLTENEKTVIVNYYGLFGAPPLKLREIGEIMGFTESRASQLHTNASQKLRLLGANEAVSSLSNRLWKVKDRPRYTSESAFSERIYNELERLRDRKLHEEEIQTVLVHVNEWKLNTVKIGDNSYSLLHRHLPKGIELSEISLSNDQEERRKIGQKDDRITILVREIRGSDLQLLLETEKQLRFYGREYNEDFAAQFSDRELQVISHLYEPYGQLGLKLGIEKSTVRTFIHYAAQKIGLSGGPDLAVAAAREGLIDMDAVPSGRTALLTVREEGMLRDHYNHSYDEGAQSLGLANSTYRTHWHNIYTKMGALTRTQVVLMAIKDGLIPLEEKEEQLSIQEKSTVLL